jgi:hypothetical protein
LPQHFCAKKDQTINISTKKLSAKLSYEKAARKMLVKLTSGVFFWLLVYPVSVEKTLLEGTQSDASLS